MKNVTDSMILEKKSWLYFQNICFKMLLVSSENYVESKAPYMGVRP